MIQVYLKIRKKIKEVLLLSMMMMVVSCVKVRKEYYADGNIRVKGELTGDVLDGDYKSYYSDGTIESFGKFEMGRKVGKWKWYGINGEVELDAEYKNDKLNGDYIRYDTLGNKKVVGSFINNHKNGKFLEYYSNGNIESIQHYTLDTLEGIYKSYYEEGSLKMDAIMNKGIAVYFEKYNHSGKTIDSHNKIIVKPAGENSNGYNLILNGDISGFWKKQLILVHLDLITYSGYETLIAGTVIDKVFVLSKTPLGEINREEVKPILNFEFTNSEVSFKLDEVYSGKIVGMVLLSRKINGKNIDSSFPFELK